MASKNNKNDSFLSTYKEFETLLRELGLDYKEIEDQTTEVNRNRMRILRMMRNFLSHNDDDDFVTANDTQIEYLRYLINLYRLKGDIVKKHTKTLHTGACCITDKCVDAADKLCKLKVSAIPVYDDKQKILGLVTPYDILPVLSTSKAKTLSDVKKFSKDYICLPANTLMSEIDDIDSDKLICCTEDGKATGKLLGVLFR